MDIYTNEIKSQQRAALNVFMLLVSFIQNTRAEARGGIGGSQGTIGTGLRASQRSCKLKEPEPDFFADFGTLPWVLEFLIWTYS